MFGPVDRVVQNLFNSCANRKPILENKDKLLFTIESAILS